MSNNYEIVSTERTAIRITVQLSDSLSTYAKDFLHIYNNVKEHEELLKLYNTYGNDVIVVCETSVKEEALQYLENFGEIKLVEEVIVIQPEIIVSGILPETDKDFEILKINESSFY